MTDEERVQVLRWREQLDRPLHSVHHVDSGRRHYMITAACVRHEAYLGQSIGRMSDFTAQLLQVLGAHCSSIEAWVVLPNHYHVLAGTGDVLAVLKALGRLHGRTSFQWNGEDAARGRQVWNNATETVIRGTGHFGAARKYVHHNPVKHRYVARWTDWAWSSASDYLADTGREEAAQEYGLYDIERFGAGWDDADI